MTLEVSQQSFRGTEISNFMKILPVGSSCFMRRDSHDEANSRFPQFCGPIPKTKDRRMLIIIVELIDILIYLLTANELPHGGSSTVHIYTKKVHRTTQ
jgi:hypothetical protein